MFKVLDIYTMDYTYLRNRNHVTGGLEAKLASMYGAGKVFLTSSCMEAVTSLLEYLLPDKGTVVVNRDTYYETRQWLRMVKRYDVKEVDISDRAALTEAVRDADVLYYDNPSFFYEEYDADTVNRIAHEAGAKVIVDNTVLSLYYRNPVKGDDEFNYSYKRRSEYGFWTSSIKKTTKAFY